METKKPERLFLPASIIIFQIVNLKPLTH